MGEWKGWRVGGRVWGSGRGGDGKWKGGERGRWTQFKRGGTRESLKQEKMGKGVHQIKVGWIILSPRLWQCTWNSSEKKDHKVANQFISHHRCITIATYLPSFRNPLLHGFPAFWTILFRSFLRATEVKRIFVWFVGRDWFVCEVHVWLIQALDEEVLCSVIIGLVRHTACDFKNLWEVFYFRVFITYKRQHLTT